MEKIRPITITAASLAFIIFGAVTIIYSVLLGIALSSAANLSGTMALVVGGLIILVAAIGILDILAGYGLWHIKRWAAIMGMLLSIFGLIVQSFYSLIFAATYYPTYAYSLSYGGTGSPWIYIILVILIAISWKSFEPSAN